MLGNASTCLDGTTQMEQMVLLSSGSGMLVWARDKLFTRAGNSQPGQCLRKARKKNEYRQCKICKGLMCISSDESITYIVLWTVRYMMLEPGQQMMLMRNAKANEVSDVERKSCGGESDGDAYSHTDAFARAIQYVMLLSIINGADSAERWEREMGTENTTYQYYLTHAASAQIGCVLACHGDDDTGANCRRLIGERVCTNEGKR